MSGGIARGSAANDAPPLRVAIATARAATSESLRISEFSVGCALPDGSAFDVGVLVLVDRRTVETSTRNHVGSVVCGVPAEAHDHHNGDDESDAVGPSAGRIRITLLDALFPQRLADEPAHDEQDDEDGDEGADEPHHIGLKALNEAAQGQGG